MKYEELKKIREKLKEDKINRYRNRESNFYIKIENKNKSDKYV